MRKMTYRTIDDVLRSSWAALSAQREAVVPRTDRVLRSTRLEDSIYTDLRDGDEAMDRIEQASERKLASFPALSRDVFQSFYSLSPRRMEESSLSTAARKFNAPILEHVIQSEDYPTLKSVCEGRELPAYEAAAEFTDRLGSELDGLLSNLGGEKGTGSTLEKLEQAEIQAREELSALLEKRRAMKVPNKVLEQAIISTANIAESKHRQAEAVGKLMDTAAARHKGEVAAFVDTSMKRAAEKAEETAMLLSAWSDEPGNMEKTEENIALLERIRDSQTLRNVARYLGRFREIFARGKRNGFAYGRGETYSLELGNDLSRALSSELSLLAVPESIPLFLQKYQHRQIKQYRRRDPIRKGAGDIICCLDESGSTKGEPAAWGKAVAITLLEIAADGGRKFALIHFSGADSIQTDIFLPGQYTAEDKMRAAETFLGGGTNFVTPMAQALELMERQGFENADIVFISDGECKMPEDFLEHLRVQQAARRFTVTGILLEQGTPGMEFSLQEFCRNIYRTSELTETEIVENLVSDRV